MFNKLFDVAGNSLRIHKTMNKICTDISAHEYIEELFKLNFRVSSHRIELNKYIVRKICIVHFDYGSNVRFHNLERILHGSTQSGIVTLRLIRTHIKSAMHFREHMKTHPWGNPHRLLSFPRCVHWHGQNFTYHRGKTARVLYP